MAMVLKGVPVAKALNEKMIAKVKVLKEKGVEPTLAILRVGEKADDLAYEKGAVKRCEQVGVAVKKLVFAEDVDAVKVYSEIQKLNQDSNVHGILVFRPLPKHIDDEKVRCMIDPNKDVDGCTDASLAGVFTDSKVGYAPCTAQAAMEILKHYNVDLDGKRAVVLGRSLVVGRPVAMLLMHENATVTMCHSRTRAVAEAAKTADVLVVCTGQMESIDAEYLREGQVIVDVGISWNDAKGKLCGDVDFDAAEPIVSAITPVPGGVGAVTTSILVSHVVEAAERDIVK